MRHDIKSQSISKEQVWHAYLEVRKKGKAAGVDGVTLSAYDQDRTNSLFKLWNRMASGSYFPPAVRRVRIEKQGGGNRPLGIPTVDDRIAQMVVKKHLEPLLEKQFHRNSFGYRPNRKACDAVDQCTTECWKKPWVIDLDIKGFFDNLDHDLLMKALKRHTKESWVILYIERWLKAPIQDGDNTYHPDRGIPQGGVISPLLSNLFLHYAFDLWMEKNFPGIVFERYADDIVIHCITKKQSEYLLSRIRQRLETCKLELHPNKTKIVFCKQSKFKEHDASVSFDFLGFTYKPRKMKNRKLGGIFLGYGPGISSRASKKINRELRQMTLHKKVRYELSDLAKLLAPKLRGWIQYFGRINLHSLRWLMFRVNDRLARWARKRYKRYKESWKRARLWLKDVYRNFPNLFIHWQYGFKP